ncbi:hypothetical protein WMF11_41755 [Sorangium sp. So ce295]|uniref:5'-methylthioadenosine/S-adenosylhomocysteine nucleosidase family protein n=1 Tax=Sorangium sp. So ce295 TaxID=3133295 RepID=UPI003F62EC8D
MSTDVLLVAVTSVETKAILEAFGDAVPANPLSIDGRVYFDLGPINGARLKLTRCEMGAGGLGASQQAVAKGIAALSPAAVIMVGIAFGVNEEKQSIGDILVTEQLRPYELQRVGTEADGSVKFILRDDKPHASPWLLNLLKSSEVTWDGAALRFGTVLTGSKLVDSLDFREQLRGFELEAIGGEMEGAGLYVACHAEKVDWILVKAICDFADGQKAKDKATRQALAAKNAAEFVLHVLQFVKVDWASHKTRVRGTGSSAVFETFDDLSGAVCTLLMENRLLFDALGPNSDAATADPSSNLHQLWELRRLDRIVPNNRKIVDMVAKNISLVPQRALSAFHKFKLHAEAYERHVNSPLDQYPRFPTEFAEELKCRD